MRLIMSVIFIAALAISVETFGATCTASAEAIFSPFEFEIDNCEVIKNSKGFYVDLSKLTTGDDTRDKHMKEKYLEVSKYPVATFKFTAKNKKSFTGILTLHGKKNQVRGKRDGETYKFKVDTKKFGISQAGYGSITIGRHITVTVTL